MNDTYLKIKAFKITCLILLLIFVLGILPFFVVGAGWVLVLICAFFVWFIWTIVLTELTIRRL